MKIVIDTDKTSLLTIFTVSGKMDFNELLAFIETFHVDSIHTKKCLLDFRLVTGGERVTVLQMGQFYSLCEKCFYGKPAQKISFVVGDDVGFGFEQILSIFEELYDVYLNVRVFRNHADAMKWLEVYPE